MLPFANVSLILSVMRICFFQSFWQTHMSFFSKPEWVLPYSNCRGKCNVHSPRSTSGATCADLLAASLLPVLSPHTIADVGCRDSNFAKFCLLTELALIL